jgi:hypothetical protein
VPGRLEGEDTGTPGAAEGGRRGAPEQMKTLMEQTRWYQKAFDYALRGGSHPGYPNWGTEV